MNYINEKVGDGIIIVIFLDCLVIKKGFEKIFKFFNRVEIKKIEEILCWLLILF